MTFLRTLALAAVTPALFTACAALPQRPLEPAAVVLVSIDGFRADYLDRGLTPNLQRIADGGVRARWMNPSYPTLTFPNHYTLVTGLRPDHHGIVHNTMRDAVLGNFKSSDTSAASKAEWWNGEPIWVRAEKAGLPTATMFWPGSQAAIGGVRPTRWQPYDETVSMATRVDTVLGWLGESLATRPRLSTLYFEALDHASHDHGPDSPQMRAALVQIDEAIGRLLRGLAARGLSDRVNLVVVSDHGMAAVPPGHSVDIASLVDAADASLVTHGEVLGFQPVAGREAAAEAQLLGRHEHVACWRKGELPPQWHYGTHARIPPIVCQMETGWKAEPQAEREEHAGSTRGAHGFAPQAPQMRALFLADGPAFRSHVTLAPFDNVDVYSLLAHLLGITPAANDGSFTTWQPALRDDASP